jgi:hypothetical protein
MGLQGPKGDKGDKGEQGEPGTPGSVTFVTEIYTGAEQTSDNTRHTIPGGSLAALVPVTQFYLPNGDFVLDANIDLAATLPIGQQYTCQLKVANQTDPVDSLPVIYGVQTRLHLAGVVHLYSAALVTLSCGSDAPARLLKGRLHALHVDRINPSITGTPGSN